jgi:carbon-monoxide dehydrogenase medium subunit
MTGLVRARTVDEAIEALADGEGHALAGGQAMTILMKEGFVDAARLVDISGVGELRGITRHPGHVDVGAMSTHVTVARDSTLAASIPGLADAFSSIGNVRIRAAGTLGGNLAHADPRQDPPTALVLLDAAAHVRGASGPRSIAVADLIDGALSTTLDADELITSVRIPVLGEHEWFGFSKFLAGSSEGFATANLALRVSWTPDGTIERADMCVGAVGPLPQRVQLASTVRFDDRARSTIADDVAIAVAEAVEPTGGHQSGSDYTRALCGELARDLYCRFVDGAQGRRAA